MATYRIIIEPRNEDDANFVREFTAAHSLDVDTDAIAASLDAGVYYTDAYRIERMSDYVAGLWPCVRYRQPSGVIGGCESSR